MTGNVTVEINSTTAAVNESFLVGGAQVGIALDAGKFVRVTGDNVSLNILGQQVSGNFVLEQITIAGTPSRQITRVGIDHASVSLTQWHD